MEMKNLIKRNELNNVSEYYEMCVESLNVGQREQAREEFKAMPKLNQFLMIEEMLTGWELPYDTKMFFFELLKPKS